MDYRAINVQIVNLVLTIKVEDSQLIFKCLNCNRENNKDFNKELFNRFSNTYKLCNGNINRCFVIKKRNLSILIHE